MAVRKKGRRLWVGAGAASQPLPSGDPDVRPWLLLDHCLYFVIDLLEAVPFHDSCSRTRDEETGREEEIWNHLGRRKRKRKRRIINYGLNSIMYVHWQCCVKPLSNVYYACVLQLPRFHSLSHKPLQPLIKCHMRQLSRLVLNQLSTGFVRKLHIHIPLTAVICPKCVCWSVEMPPVLPQGPRSPSQLIQLRAQHREVMQVDMFRNRCLTNKVEKSES